MKGDEIMFDMEYIIKWIKNKKVKVILIILALFFVPLIVVHLLFKLNTGIYFLQADWSSGELIGYIAGFEAFIGTITLGVVAVVQTSQANSLSKNLLELENNKYRPYIKIGIDDKFYINKDANGFSDKVNMAIDDETIRYEGIAVTKNTDEDNINSFWPIVAVFKLAINNIGDSSISSINLKRFLVLNNGIGALKGITSSVDTSVFSKATKKVLICASAQVLISEDKDNPFINDISNNHKKMIKAPTSRIQIEMTLEYSDIFGRSFFQEYTIRFSFDLSEETSSEYIFEIKDSSIEQHVGKSPYGPRIDEADIN